MHYIKGWFLIDLLSVVPFWTLTLDYNDPLNRGSAGTTLSARSSTLRATVLVRIVKLLRMLKLTRVFKASRVIQRVLLDVVTNQWEWTYAVLKMVKLIVVLTVYAHWQACIWGLVSSYMGDSPNWIASFDDDYIATFGRSPQAIERYVAALYWSVMTLTSIGYGEFTPVNTAERVLCSIYMMLSGVMWTYAIGSVASIATTLNPNTLEFHNTMDQLNYFMRERGLPRGMRLTLRDYFSSARRVHQLNDDSELLNKMSPLLQGTVALAANKQWIDKIWYFRDIATSIRSGREFVAYLAKSLTIRSYVSHERLPVGQLYVLRRGLVVKMWRFLGSGKVWGEDVILDSVELMDHSQAVALTYVEAYTLRRNDLDEVLEEYPDAKRQVSRAARKVSLQRALLKYLALHNWKRAPNSFVPRSAAAGFSEVQEQRTLEQKVDTLLARSQHNTQQQQQQQQQSAPSPLGSPRQQQQQQQQQRQLPPPPSPHTLPPIAVNGGGSENSTQLLSMMHEQRSELNQLKHDMIEIKTMLKSLADGGR